MGVSFGRDSKETPSPTDGFPLHRNAPVSGSPMRSRNCERGNGRFGDRKRNKTAQLALELAACLKRAKGEIMIVSRFTRRALTTFAGATTALLIATAGQASIMPSSLGANTQSGVQTVGCLLGAHVGPLGACIGGTRVHHCWINRFGNRVCN
jgi:hypothetical protein